jgi:hypothetical protein
LNSPIRFEVDDLIVLLLGAPTKSPALQGKISGITRLEKLIFLLERETPIGERLTEKPDFVAHNFGPFSQKVYQAIDSLASADLIKDSAHVSNSDDDSWETEEFIDDALNSRYTTRDLQLTPRGRRYYDALVGELHSDTESIVSNTKNRFGVLPLQQLIRYVYRRHPEEIERSTIRDRILGSDT